MEKVNGKKIKNSNKNVKKDSVSVDKKAKTRKTKKKVSSTKDYFVSSIRPHKIHAATLEKYTVSSFDEEVLDVEIEKDDNFSMGLVILILVACFGLGVSLGYILYRLAINNSAIIFIR